MNVTLPSHHHIMTLISLKTNHINWLIASTTTEIVTDTSYEQLKTYKNEIDSYVTVFNSNTKLYEDNEARLLQVVTSFIKNHGVTSKTNIEQLFVNRIDQGYGEASPSLIAKFSKDLLNEDKYSKRQSSPNRMVYDFYLSVLSTSMSMINALQRAYKVKAQLTKGN